MRCPLCSHEFDAREGRCAPACPLQSGCHFICCPRCGYAIADEAKSTSARWLRRWKRARPRGRITLADLRDGEAAQIAHIQSDDPARDERLIAYGLVPGQRVTLVQKRPAFVIRVEQTELAMDEQVARFVFLAPEPP